MALPRSTPSVVTGWIVPDPDDFHQLDLLPVVLWTTGAADGTGVPEWIHRPERGDTVDKRFLQLADVAEVLNISASQAYALVRNGDLPAIKIGGRGQWRVGRDDLERYIEKLYAETAAYIAANPYQEAEVEDEAAG
jgi:excisionase family DNA binding protein